MTMPNPHPFSNPRGFSLNQLLVIVAVIVIVASLMVPGMNQSRRASNERQASASLKTMASAEADFRANDRDGNGVNDFWTGDAKGLYTMTSAAVRGARGDLSDPPLRLIDLPLAASDLDRTRVAAGGENMDLSTFASPAPKDGYWVAALVADLSAGAADANSLYRLDTGGSLPMGKCHHPSKFGFITLPNSLRTARFVYILDEGHSVRRRALTCEVWTKGAAAPGLEAVQAEFQNWPSDKTLRSSWGRDG